MFERDYVKLDEVQLYLKSIQNDELEYQDWISEGEPTFGRWTGEAVNDYEAYNSNIGRRQQYVYVNSLREIEDDRYKRVASIENLGKYFYPVFEYKDINEKYYKRAVNFQVAYFWIKHLHGRACKVFNSHTNPDTSYAYEIEETDFARNEPSSSLNEMFKSEYFISNKVVKPHKSVGSYKEEKRVKRSQRDKVLTYVMLALLMVFILVVIKR